MRLSEINLTIYFSKIQEIKKPFDGGRPAKVVMLKDGKIFAVGFSKMAERLYALYDPVSTCAYVFK